jgi:predicted NBD/HSP70 family sugar kinase
MVRNVNMTLRDAEKVVGAALGPLSGDVLDRIIGVVVAVPAPVNRRANTANSRWFPAAGAGPLNDLFHDELSLDDYPIATVSDVVARAIGEGRFGLARASHSAFVMKVSGGIAGTPLRRGRVLSGFRGVAGEVGHVGISLNSVPAGSGLPPLDVNAECSCGDSEGQHLEAYASTPAIVQRLEASRGEQLDFEDVARNWQHQEDARRCVEDASRLLGEVAATVVSTYDPERIVITGRFAACGDDAVKPVRRALDAMQPSHGDSPVVEVDGPIHPGDSDDWEWVGVQGAGRLAIEIETSVENPPTV